MPLFWHGRQLAEHLTPEQIGKALGVSHWIAE
jgi:hypothetical protein